MKTYANNKSVKFNYFIEEKYEAGIVLTGTEVKSVRKGKLSLKESFVKIKEGEVFLMQTHITKPETAVTYIDFDETRPKKLLMKKSEISKLQKKISQKGYTLVASKIFQPDNSSKIKVEVCLAKGKKLHDKKQVIKERDIKRETDRILKDF